MVKRVYVLTLFAVLVSACLSGAGAAPKKHRHGAKLAQAAHHAQAAVRRQAAQRRAQAQHLARLAAREKAAWQAHLAKVRALPHAKRIALKRHERRERRQEKQAARPAPVPKQAARRQIAHGPHLTRRQIAHRQHLAAALALHAGAVAAHNAHLARQRNAYLARLAQQRAVHNARLAQQQAVVKAHLARQQAVHNAHLAQQHAAYLARLRLMAQRSLNHQTRVVKQQATHNARLAAQRAHWVALHGDGSGGHSIQFWETVAAGVPVKVISVDLNDTNVKVSAVMARRGSGTAEPFRQMVARANPNVAVTGTFFSLDNLQPIGDIVIGGGLVHFGGMGTALCITPHNRAEMVTCEWGRHHDWSPYDFVCACGPRLLRHGRIVLDPHAERFKDRHMLAPNSRIAVGITRGNKIVFAMTHDAIYLGRLAKVMRSLGAAEAMNLDAGTSTGFYYNGATLARPGRALTNMIVVYGRRERYRRALDQLVPAAYRRTWRVSTRRQVS